jgi:hypothetical protein
VKVATAAVAVAYACVVASVRPFTVPALVLVVLPALVVLAIALPRLGRSAPRRPRRRGLVPWALLAAAILAWELIAYFQSPRHDHPTLSSMLDTLESNRPARAVLFVAWLAIGRQLARR